MELTTRATYVSDERGVRLTLPITKSHCVFDVCSSLSGRGPGLVNPQNPCQLFHEEPMTDKRANLQLISNFRYQLRYPRIRASAY